MTGREGSFHTQQMIEYGTQVVGGITPGTYDVEVKESRRMGRIARNLQLTAGVTTRIFGDLLAGDVNGDDVVSLVDYSRLRASYGKCVGDTGYQPAADFTGDGCVTLPDYSRLRATLGVRNNQVAILLRLPDDNISLFPD